MYIVHVVGLLSMRFTVNYTTIGVVIISSSMVFIFYPFLLYLFFIFITIRFFGNVPLFLFPLLLHFQLLLPLLLLHCSAASVINSVSAPSPQTRLTLLRPATSLMYCCGVVYLMLYRVCRVNFRTLFSISPIG